MDDNQELSEKTKVGFPNANESKKGGSGKLIFLVLIILLILGGATWYLLSNREETIEFKNETVTPILTEETPTPMKKLVDKSTLKLQVLNGTGTPGDAGKLEDALNELGYSEISTGNADNYDFDAAELTFSENFPEDYKNEIIEKLEKMYSSIKMGNTSLGEYSAVLITGKIKGSTTKTTPSITKKPTMTLSPTTRPSITSTP